jgi:hypothetical protein
MTLSSVTNGTIAGSKIGHLFRLANMGIVTIRSGKVDVSSLRGYRSRC